MLQINLLGNFAVSLDGRRLHPDLGPSGQRMAAYLCAFPGRPHRRERLADMFWPDLAYDRSRAAMNSAVWRFRKILGQGKVGDGAQTLKTEGSEIILNPPSYLEIDIHRLGAIYSGLKAEALDPSNMQQAARLREGINLYGGPFLESESDIVFIEQREFVHTKFVALAQMLIRLNVLSGVIGEAITTCRKVIYYDQYRESFIRQLLILLVLDDQRAEALRFYAYWKASLRKELNVDPMPGTAHVVGLVRSCESHADIERLRDVLLEMASLPPRKPA
jgi:DNA-binding SARP family transcriptional activator